MSRRGIAIAAAVLSLAVTAAAVAAGEKPRVEFNAADQRAARAVVLKRSDFDPPTGWKGGAEKSDLGGGPTCPNYKPKQSDLVVTGAAAAGFAHAKSGLEFVTDVHVLKTAAMVRLDWQRSVRAPGVMPCLREFFSKDLPAGTKFRSFGKLRFPKVATYTAAFRLILDVTDGGRSMPVVVDVVLIGRGRTELTLIATAPYGARVAVNAAEVRLARSLVARIAA